MASGGLLGASLNVARRGGSSSQAFALTENVPSGAFTLDENVPSGAFTLEDLDQMGFLAAQGLLAFADERPPSGLKSPDDNAPQTAGWTSSTFATTSFTEIAFTSIGPQPSLFGAGSAPLWVDASLRPPTLAGSPSYESPPQALPTSVINRSDNLELEPEGPARGPHVRAGADADLIAAAPAQPLLFPTRGSDALVDFPMTTDWQDRNGNATRVLGERTPAAVPEPASFLLIATAALGLFYRLRRRHQLPS
jgi:hypothetical protein